MIHLMINEAELSNFRENRLNLVRGSTEASCTRQDSREFFISFESNDCSNAPNLNSKFHSWKNLFSVLPTTCSLYEKSDIIHVPAQVESSNWTKVSCRQRNHLLLGRGGCRCWLARGGGECQAMCKNLTGPSWAKHCFLTWHKYFDTLPTPSETE